MKQTKSKYLQWISILDIVYSTLAGLFSPLLLLSLQLYWIFASFLFFLTFIFYYSRSDFVFRLRFTFISALFEHCMCEQSFVLYVDFFFFSRALFFFYQRLSLFTLEIWKHSSQMAKTNFYFMNDTKVCCLLYDATHT